MRHVLSFDPSSTNTILLLSDIAGQYMHKICTAYNVYDTVNFGDTYPGPDKERIGYKWTTIDKMAYSIL